MKDQTIKKISTQRLNLKFKTDKKTINFMTSLPPTKCPTEAEEIIENASMMSCY